jgi:predicted O-methyltransferase YrrM
VDNKKSIDTEYEFTTDWFHWAPDIWLQLKPMIPRYDEHGTEFLEIGSFEGRSTMWTIENLMKDGDHITCIDTWEGGEEHSKIAMSEVEQRFTNNLQVAYQKFPARAALKRRGTSAIQLAGDICDQFLYDFIYVDGSHTAKDVLSDAVMAWKLLAKGGLMVFDDYVWGDPRDVLHRPKLAIDSFVNIYAEEVELVFAGYQLVIRKKP